MDEPVRRYLEHAIVLGTEPSDHVHLRFGTPRYGPSFDARVLDAADLA